ncbi:unnamed protein product, partial [Urochloa humidicola]
GARIDDLPGVIVPARPAGYRRRHRPSAAVVYSPRPGRVHRGAQQRDHGNGHLEAGPHHPGLLLCPRPAGHVLPLRPIRGLRGFKHKPRVVGAEGRFVLLSVRFDSRNDEQLFMYKSDPVSPSLERVPSCGIRVKEFGIVPRGDEGRHYLLVARRLANYMPHSSTNL